ncbi:AAA family ATPase [Chitinibacter bivalviorum]|uniref:AAA family ATPase n=1 Tax=Chitinibacter bivalviorum TaxID=2739434 RepID=A0A7H9BH09_9NEIS|nr:AAA family ATPase [Chitinibacter bivalviorum]QLG88000.1 AAA family ATPase [Chitinibacter bivalviorum]
MLHLPLECTEEVALQLEYTLAENRLNYYWNSDLNGEPISPPCVKSEANEGTKPVVCCLAGLDAEFLAQLWPYLNSSTVLLLVDDEVSSWHLPAASLPANNATMKQINVQPARMVNLVDPQKLEIQMEAQLRTNRPEKTAELGKLGHPKQLILASDHHYYALLKFYEQQKQHHEFFQVLLRRIKHQAATHAPLHLGNLLLIGPAGNGKSWLCAEVCRILEVPMLCIQLSGNFDGMLFQGSSAQWNNADAGRVAKFMAGCRYANPVIVIEEVDKTVSMSSGKGDYTDAMLMLLEKQNSRQFMDNFLATPINMEHASFMLTANDLERISSPMLSRVRVFKTEAPTAAELQRLASMLYHSLLEEMECGQFFDSKVDNAILCELASRCDSIRSLKAALIEAIEFSVDVVEDPNALRKLRGQLTLRLPPVTPQAALRRIGFF